MASAGQSSIPDPTTRIRDLLYIVRPHRRAQQPHEPIINTSPSTSQTLTNTPPATPTMVSSTVLTTLITLLLLPHPIHSFPTGTPLKRSDSLPFFTGRGLIHVLNSTDLTKASPTANIIGCLDQHGQLVTASTLPSQCALFTRADALPNVLSTSAGNCSFLDPSTPQNKDSIYGRNTHAWWCGGSAGDGSGGLEYYYTLVSPASSLFLELVWCCWVVREGKES